FVVGSVPPDQQESGIDLSKQLASSENSMSAESFQAVNRVSTSAFRLTRVEQSAITQILRSLFSCRVMALDTTTESDFTLTWSECTTRAGVLKSSVGALTANADFGNGLPKTAFLFRLTSTTTRSPSLKGDVFPMLSI